MQVAKFLSICRGDIDRFDGNSMALIALYRCVVFTSKAEKDGPSAELNTAQIQALVLLVVHELREHVIPVFHRAIAVYEVQPVLQRLV